MSSMSRVSFSGLFGSAIVVSITAYFGAYPETESSGGKLMRAITLGFALIGVMMLGTLLALAWGSVQAVATAMSAFPPIETTVTPETVPAVEMP